MTAHRFHPSLLREYDLRGIVGETLSPADARAVGRAFASRLKAKGAGAVRVCVGRDGRPTSPVLESALIEGLRESGADIIGIGMGPTPMLYFAAKILGTEGAVMVTGSHNPAGHNGFKLLSEGGPFFGADIQELGRIAAEGRFASGKGSLTTEDVAERYIDRLAADAEEGRPLKVAWDAGNGAAGAVLARLTERLPGRHLLLNEDVDGTFPAHHPDPTMPENLRQLQETVVKESCDLGFAFDGDGDRIGVVDDEGAILWADLLLVFLAEEVLRDRPGATIIADVKASQALFDEIARMGGKPLMWRTGHSLIKAKMAETGAPLAGEMSGHLFFADRYYGFDDALYAAVRTLNAVGRMDRPLSRARARLPRAVNTPELRFPCPEERKFAIIEEVKARLARAGAEVSAVDGVRVRSGGGWWLLRASNTQAVLVARCEADSEQGLARARQELAVQLEASGITPPPF